MSFDCQETCFRELAQIGDLVGDLSKRPLEEICAERALIEILYSDLARRPLWQILYRDLVNRAQILLKDLV